MIQAEQIKDRVSMPEVCEQYGIKINSHGYACCPFHGEKTASFRVWRDHYYCFGCEERGDVITLTQKMFGLKFAQACLKLNTDFSLGLGGQRVSYAMRRDLMLSKRIEASRQAFVQMCKADIDRLTDRRRKIYKLYLRCGDENMRKYIEQLDNELDMRLGRLETI